MFENSFVCWTWFKFRSVSLKMFEVALHNCFSEIFNSFVNKRLLSLRRCTQTNQRVGLVTASQSEARIYPPVSPVSPWELMTFCHFSAQNVNIAQGKKINYRHERWRATTFVIKKVKVGGAQYILPLNTLSCYFEITE